MLILGWNKEVCLLQFSQDMGSCWFVMMSNNIWHLVYMYFLPHDSSCEVLDLPSWLLVLCSLEGRNSPWKDLCFPLEATGELVKTQ